MNRGSGTGWGKGRTGWGGGENPARVAREVGHFLVRDWCADLSALSAGKERGKESRRGGVGGAGVGGGGGPEMAGPLAESRRHEE